MSNTFQHKRSSVSGNTPTAGSMAVGELAVNLADKLLFTKDGSGNIIKVGSGTLAGLADVSLTTLSAGQTLSWNGTAWVNSSAGAGSVTSVDLSVPTGLAVSGGPITSSGTLAVSFAAGYSIPTTTKQGQWDTAYSERAQWDGGATNLNATTARSSLGLVIGTNVQAYDADLAAIAALAPTADNFIVGNGTTWTLETPAQARTSLGATTLGSNLFTLANVAAIAFPRINADNTVSTLDAATFRTAIGAGTSSTTGTVTSVGGTGTVSGLTLTGTVTSTGNLTLGGTLAVTPSNFASQTANYVLAAPNGAAGTPTFRALVAADIPTLNQNTTGSAGSVAWSGITSKPTTLSGYGITDAPTATGTGASGTWGINVTGSAGTAGTATYLSATAQTNVITGKTQSMAMSTTDTTNNGSFVVRASSTGDANLAGITFWNDSYAIKMGIRADGYFGLGGWSRATWSWYSDPSGNMVAAGNVTAYSDERKKTNWRDLPVDFIEKLATVKHGIYDRTDETITQVGVSAQSLRGVMPHAVVTGIDGWLSVSYGSAALTSAVQLAKRVLELESRLAALEGRAA